MAGALRRACKRFASLRRIRGTRGRLGIAAGIATLVSAAAPVLTASASDLAGTSAVCNVTMTLTFSPSLTLLPGPGGFSVSGSGTCVGPGGGSLSLTGSGIALEGLAADCAVIVATGTGVLTLPFEQPAVAFDIAGLTVAQSWTLLNSGGTQVIATGALDASPLDVAACATGATTTMTLTGVLAVIA